MAVGTPGTPVNEPEKPSRRPKGKLYDLNHNLNITFILWPSLNGVWPVQRSQNADDSWLSGLTSCKSISVIVCLFPGILDSNKVSKIVDKVQYRNDFLN